MAKHWETFDHTADVGLAARADSLGELLEALAEGLADQICPIDQVQPLQTRQVSADSEDAEALAVDFLVEVMNLIQVDHFLVRSARVLDASATRVRAELCGESYDPARHVLASEVKAVTYHQLTIARQAGVWVGRVILDL